MSGTAGAGKLQERTRTLMGPLTKSVWKVERKGYERLPETGPAILCPNHISFVDSMFLMLTVPRNVSFVGKAEYMDSWKTKYIFPALGMIPIDRSGGTKSASALEAAAEVLGRGELFGIFPEGTRSRDGYLYKGRTGAARLSMETGAPIYPVGITGTDAIQPPGAKFPKPFARCRIEIGRPVRPERYASRNEPYVAWRSMIDEVMFEIREMTGQEYRNRYAGEPADATTEERTTAVPAHVDDEVDVAGRRRELVAAGI